MNAMGEKGARGEFVKLAIVIALESTNRATELSGDPNEEVGEVGKVSDLSHNGEILRK
jgi:hypothetical protein